MEDSQQFTGIDPAKWDRIRLKVLNEAGIDITSNLGSGSAKGISLSWSYVPDSETLTATLVKRSWYDPSEAVIETDLAAMVTAA